MAVLNRLTLVCARLAKPGRRNDRCPDDVTTQDAFSFRSAELLHQKFRSRKSFGQRRERRGAFNGGRAALRVCLAFSWVAAVRPRGRGFLPFARDSHPFADDAQAFGVDATFQSSDWVREQDLRDRLIFRSAPWLRFRHNFACVVDFRLRVCWGVRQPWRCPAYCRLLRHSQPLCGYVQRCSLSCFPLSPLPLQPVCFHLFLLPLRLLRRLPARRPCLAPRLRSC